MLLDDIGDYNRDQLMSFRAIREIMERLSPAEMDSLVAMIRPYLHLRRKVDEYHFEYFHAFCKEACFDTCLSACCGFESIITFFADQVITLLHSSDEDVRLLLEALQKPNDTGKCVYLGSGGCIWRIRPVSCAMFFCQDSKEAVFEARPEAADLWQELLDLERNFTWPTQSVLFDELEKFFLRYGVESPHLYFHKSPGLLRLKAEAGLES